MRLEFPLLNQEGNVIAKIVTRSLISRKFERENSRVQVKTFQQNGRHVRVIWLKNASRYLFTDHTRAVVKEMMRFLPSSNMLKRK